MTSLFLCIGPALGATLDSHACGINGSLMIQL